MSVIPTDSYFQYNRKYAPLYFAEPNQQEKLFFKNNIVKIAREYFKITRLHNICCNTPLSNGMTAGEYSMWVIYTQHIRRNL